MAIGHVFRQNEIAAGLLGSGQDRGIPVGQRIGLMQGEGAIQYGSINGLDGEALPDGDCEPEAEADADALGLVLGKLKLSYTRHWVR